MVVLCWLERMDWGNGLFSSYALDFSICSSFLDFGEQAERTMLCSIQALVPALLKYCTANPRRVRIDDSAPIHVVTHQNRFDHTKPNNNQQP